MDFFSNEQTICYYKRNSNSETQVGWKWNDWKRYTIQTVLKRELVGIWISDKTDLKMLLKEHFKDTKVDVAGRCNNYKHKCP
jgi:hypothetical protein